MDSGIDALPRAFDYSNLWELELLEPRVLLSAAMVSSAPSEVLKHPTMLLQGISPDINSPPGSAYTPSQINSAYGFNQVLFGSVAGTGSGQTVAIIDAYDDPNALNDLNQFSLQFGLPLFNVSGGPTFTKVGQTGGAVPGTDPAAAGSNTWELEESLDIEWVHAIAPGANIILVEAVAPTFADLVQTAVVWAANQPSVVAVSMSFSGDESSDESSYDSCFTTPSGHAGVTFLASTGDTGEPSGYPAYSPNVVAVGGTSLTMNGSAYGSETAWSGSGGGISNYESQPSYQNGLVTQSTTQRTAPDVSMVADPYTGVAIYDSYDYPSTPWLQIGGTSLSCPLWAGTIAIVDQGRAALGLSSLDGATKTLPALYNLPAADFHDITSGSNGYSAGAGYDLVTGRGTPVANRLIPDLVGAVAGQPTKLSFTRQPTSTGAGTAIDPATGVQVAVQDMFDGTSTSDASSVTLTLTGGTFAGGGNTVTVAAVNGIATFNNLVIDAPGNYTLTASDGTLTEAVSRSFTVFGAAAKLTFTQQPTNALLGTAIAPAVTIAVQDQIGNTVLTDNSTVTLTLSGGTFASGGNTVTVTAVDGIATFDNLIIDAAGACTLTASDGTLSQVTSQSFTLFYPAAKLGFTQQPTSTLAEAVIAPVVVAIQDPFGNTAVLDDSTVTLTLSSGTFSNGANTVSVVAVNGVATFTNLIVNAPGSYSLIADDGALSEAVSSSFTITGSLPSVFSIHRENPANANTDVASVTYAVTFSGPVTGVTSADFQLAFTGGASASSTVVVSPAGGYNSVYHVTVNDISGNGTVTLKLVDNGSIVDASGNHLAGSTSTFQAQQAFAVGSLPDSIFAADVNGDGKADMVVANFNSNNVSVLLGNGDGTFQPQHTFTTGWNPESVILADVNGDGKPDMVVTNANYGSASSVSVLLGNGDGTFQAQKTFATGSTPVCAAVADFNGDSKADLVVANYSSDDVSVLLGNGDGTFQNQVAFPTGSAPNSVAAADLNGDGKPDVVVTNGSDNTIGVLLGNGNGTFRAQTTFITGYWPTSVVATDVNNDGKLDLAFTDGEEYSAGVMLGNGDGTFQAQKTFSVGLEPTSVAAADMNGDGKADLVVANWNSDDVSVLIGNGDGTFQTQEVFGVGYLPASIAVTDVNGDGMPDILVACFGSDTASVLLNSNNFVSQPYIIDHPTQLAFSNQPGIGTAGAPIDGATGVQVAIKDAQGGVVIGDTSIVTLTLSSGTFASGQNTVTVAAVNGIATFNNLIINAPGTYTLTATDGNLTQATSQSFTIYGPSKVKFTVPPTNAIAGTIMTPAVIVTVEDLNGNPVPADNSNVTLTLNGGTFASGGNTVTVAAVQGVATFDNLIITAGGSYTLIASDGALTKATSQTFAVVGAPVKLGFTQQPVDTIAGTAITPAVVVAVLDQVGRTVIPDKSTVTLTLNGGTFASGGNTVTVAAVNGFATFRNLVIDAAGDYTLTATDGSLTQATSQSFAVIGAATRLGFIQQPSNGKTNVALSPAISVAIQDSLGHTVLNDNSTVTLTLSGGTFASGGNTVTVAAVNGVATFSNLVIDSAGDYTLTAADGSLTGVTSSSFTIAVAMWLKVWLDADPVANGDYSVRIWAQAVNCPAGDGIAMATITVSTPGSVGVTVPKESSDAPGYVATTWDSSISDNLSTSDPILRDMDGDGDMDAGGLAFLSTRYKVPNLGIQPVLVATETWTMTADQPVMLTVSVSSGAQHWDAASRKAVAFDYTQSTGEIVPPWPLGDVNHDDVVDAADIDTLYANFGGPSRYDLTGDGVVNQSDVDYMVKTIFQTGYADANLDRKVDFTDFQVLLDHWQLKAQGWTGGDWNGDGVTDFLDFQMLLDNWNPNGFGTVGQSSVTSMSSAAVSPLAAVQVASAAVATPAVLTASATAPASTDDSVDLLSRGVTNPYAPTQATSLSSGRNAIRPLRHATAFVQNDGGDAVDLLTHLHSRLVLR